MVGAGRPTAAQVNTAFSWSNTITSSMSCFMVGLTVNVQREMGGEKERLIGKEKQNKALAKEKDPYLTHSIDF